jgi:hypothetical protein
MYISALAAAQQYMNNFIYCIFRIMLSTWDGILEQYYVFRLSPPLK